MVTRDLEKIRKDVHVSTMKEKDIEIKGTQQLNQLEKVKNRKTAKLCLNPGVQTDFNSNCVCISWYCVCREQTAWEHPEQSEASRVRK